MKISIYIFEHISYVLIECTGNVFTLYFNHNHNHNQKVTMYHYHVSIYRLDYPTAAVISTLQISPIFRPLG